MQPRESIISPHGGYRNLKSFQVAQLAYDVTVRFCDRYIDKFSRTKDQMVQAARSGVQNIAEGSQAAGTSRKTELRLTNVARASLEELKLDYEDYLRQNKLPLLEPNHPALVRFKTQKPQTVDAFAEWVAQERKICTDKQRQTQTNNVAAVSDGERPCQSLSSAALAANGALSLLNLACYLLDRQLQTLANTFEKEGGFTERLYRVRQAERARQQGSHP